MQDRIISINSRKFDGKIHKNWELKLIEESGSCLKFIGTFDKEFTHRNLGVIRRNTVSYEFYWLDRWYNVFRFHEPDGSLRNFYCNINTPPTFDNEVLDYVDLDIDVLVWKDFSYEILDADEFEINVRRYSYPDDLRLKIETTTNELILMIENRVFPFDYKF